MVSGAKREQNKLKSWKSCDSVCLLYIGGLGDSSAESAGSRLRTSVGNLPRLCDEEEVPVEDLRSMAASTAARSKVTSFPGQWQSSRNGERELYLQFPGDAASQHIATHYGSQSTLSKERTQDSDTSFKFLPSRARSASERVSREDSLSYLPEITLDSFPSCLPSTRPRNGEEINNNSSPTKCRSAPSSLKKKGKRPTSNGTGLYSKNQMYSNQRVMHVGASKKVSNMCGPGPPANYSYHTKGECELIVNRPLTGDPQSSGASSLNGSPSSDRLRSWTPRAIRQRIYSKKPTSTGLVRQISRSKSESPSTMRKRLDANSGSGNTNVNGSVDGGRGGNTFDITGQTDAMRYPWLQDVGVQCDIADISLSLKKEKKVLDVQSKKEVDPRSRAKLSRCSSGSALIESSHSVSPTRERTRSDATMLHPPRTVRSRSSDSRNFRSIRNMSELDEGEEGAGGEEDSQPQTRQWKRRGGVLHPWQGSSGPATNEQGSPTSKDSNSENQSLPSPTSSPSQEFQGRAVNRSGSESKKKTGRTSRAPFNFFGNKKKASLEHLEGMLANLKHSEFNDEQLAAMTKIGWAGALSSESSSVDSSFQLSGQEVKRREAVWELFSRECIFFVDSLMVLKHCFMEPLKKAQVENKLMQIDTDKLFGNLDHICHISHQFCLHFLRELKEMTFDTFGEVTVIIEAMEKMISESQRDEIYKTYLFNYSDAVTHLEALENDDEFLVYIKFCEQNERCKRLRLRDFLIAPMQHWLKVPLMLENVIKYTECTDDKQLMDKTLCKLRQALTDIDKRMEWLKAYERMKEIQAQLVWTTFPEIESKSAMPESLRLSIAQSTTTDVILRDHRRQLIHEGPIVLLERDRPVESYAFLFTDFLLITKQKKDLRKKKISVAQFDWNQNQLGSFTVSRQPIPVDSIKVHSLSREEAAVSGLRNAFFISQHNVLHQIVAVLTIQAPDCASQDIWVARIQETKDTYHELYEKGGATSSIQANRKKILNHLQYLPIEAAILTPSSCSPPSSSPRPSLKRQSTEQSNGDESLLERLDEDETLSELSLSSSSPPIPPRSFVTISSNTPLVSPPLPPTNTSNTSTVSLPVHSSSDTSSISSPPPRPSSESCAEASPPLPSRSSLNQSSFNHGLPSSAINQTPRSRSHSLYDGDPVFL